MYLLSSVETRSVGPELGLYAEAAGEFGSVTSIEACGGATGLSGHTERDTLVAASRHCVNHLDYIPG